MPEVRRILRAFGPLRLYVPAHSRDHNWDTKVKLLGNVLEICFAPPEVAYQKHRAFCRVFRWIGEDLPGAPDLLPEADWNVFTDNGRKLIVEALQTKDEVSFWIARPISGGASLGHRLRILGLYALDEFQVGGREEFLRIPLRERFDYGAHKAGSVVTFGTGAGGDALRIELGVPLPEGSGLSSATLAFGGLFRTRAYMGPMGDPFTKLASPTMVIHGAAGLSFRARSWGKRFSAFGSNSAKDCETLAEIAAKSGKLPANAAFLAAFGIGDARIETEHRVEFLAHKGNPPAFAIAIRTATGFAKGLPLLGTQGPTFEAGRVEAETVATCLLPDAALKSALNPQSGEKVVPQWTLDVALRWKTKLNLSNTALIPDKPGTPPLPGGGLGEAALIARNARRGLAATKQQPQTALPELHFPSMTNEVQIPLAALPANRKLSARGELGGRISVGIGDEPHAPLRWTTTADTNPLAFAPEATSWVSRAHTNTPLATELFLWALDDRGNSAFPVTLGHVPSGSGKEDEVRFYFSHRKSDSTAKLQGRLGSLAFEGDEGRLLTEAGATLILHAPHRVPPDNRAQAETAPRLDVEWLIDLSLTQALPVTADIPHGERKSTRSPDLLISEHRKPPLEQSRDKAAGPGAEGGNATTSTLRLSLTERMRDDQDYLLKAELYDTGTTETGRSAVTVLGDKPFSIYRYSRQPLAESGGASGAAVAEYDSDDGQWLVKNVSETTYLLVHQAGATGEDTVKPGVLSLRDPASRNPTPAPVLPAEGGMQVHHALDMRLSPPTHLWIRPTDLERNFLLPEYAGRALFRQRGDFGLGVGLTALRAEALYGLAFGLMVTPAEAGLLPPRVAEIEALVGRLQPSSGKDRWDALCQAFAKRPERLEVWRLDPSARDPFKPARFTRGTSFALRHTALLARPVPERWSEPRTAEGAAIQPPRFAAHGLSGGVLWPMESANLARMLAEHPVADDGGTLEGIALTPSGVSLDQNLSFYKGGIRVISQTREGRLVKQRVEVIGRIGAHWHRAKHVVVYERTTADSPQFAPADLKETTGRAALRKVSEFVEILEPVRRYPDTDPTHATKCGFLTEVRFNARVINVDSAWGRDVGKHGWEVPLWNRGAAERRPQVYPFPDVAFVTQAEGGAEGAEAAQDCRDPHLLYFYTDAEELDAGRSDTERWPVRAGVDCSVLALRDVQVAGDYSILAKMDEASPEKGERRAAPSRLPPGLRRFTCRLAPSQTRTRINAEHGAKPVYAGVESVTFSRSFDLDGQADLAEFAKSVGEAAQAAGDMPEPAPGIALPFAVREARGANAPDSREVADTLEGLEAALTAAETPSEREVLLKDVETALGILEPATEVKNIAKFVLGGDANAKLKQVSAKVAGSKIVKRLHELDSVDCEALATKASAALNRRKLLVVQVIREIESELLGQLDTLPPGEDKLKSGLKKKLKEETDRLSAGMGEAIGGLDDGVATARSALADWRSDALAALSRAQARLAEAEAAIDKAKPWSRDRLDRALTQLAGAFGSAESEALAALNEAHQRMATELGTNVRDLTGPVAASVRSVVRARLGAHTGITGVTGQVTSQSERIQAVIARLPDLDEKRLHALRLKAAKAGKKAKDAWDKVEPTLKSLSQLKESAQKAVGTFENTATDTLEKISGNADGVAKETTKALAEVQGAIATLEAFATDLTDVGFGALADEARDLKTTIDDEIEAAGTYAKALLGAWQKETDVLEDALKGYAEYARETVEAIDAATQAGTQAADQWLERFSKQINTAKEAMPAAVKAAFDAALENGVDAAFKAVAWPAPADTVAWRAAATRAIRGVSEQAEKQLGELGQDALDKLGDVQDACKALQGAKAALIDGAGDLVKDYLGGFAKQLDDAKKPLLGFVNDAKNYLDDVDKLREYARKLEEGGTALLATADNIATEAAAAGEHARAYLSGGIERAGDLLEAKPAALPGKALELVSFLSHSPEIAALRTNADRARVYLDQAEGILKTPRVQAGLDQLGDALRALGLDFEFKEIGDELKVLLPDDRDLKSLIPQFGGIDLRNLLPNTKIPGGNTDFLRVAHDLDAKAGRAWVQVDLDLPLRDRKPLFSLGPFTLFISNSRLTSFLRAEASKNSPEVEVTDRAVLRTDMEAVVSGMALLTLQDAKISYSRARNLEFEIDPRKIRIPQAMQFVQDTFGSILGDDAGGLAFLRDSSGGVLGVEHKFGLPPMSLNFGTSGVTNIQIANRFALQAYPDFVISNRFNLSRRELPFIFSIFIIGGAGYLQLDCDYHPSGPERGLSVALEAGLGGSAALAFSLGPVSGAVYITLSIVLRFVKRIGGPARPEDGLSVSVLLVIAGNVSLWGLVTIYLGLMLAISYRESGQIDATGNLSVQVRISRWFKLKYSTSVTYKLRDGHATTTRTDELQTSGRALDALNKVNALNNARKSL